MAPANLEPGTDWWRHAVVYQVYVRSFADADGNGIGDVAGIRTRLPYLRDLGIDALWITPWYPSPLADGGYDVADYCDVDPRLGSLADADALLRSAHEHGIRVLIDLVPNHTSSAHRWFAEALAAGPGSPARRRYVFRDGRGRHGDAPPNNWQSAFGGPAWTRVVEPDGTAGQWYLHLFAPEQPDLDWANPDIHAAFESILRFWFDRGIDGVRIDVAHALVKDPALPDMPPELVSGTGRFPGEHPHWDQPGVHAIHRAWRRLADGYEPGRVLMGEVGVEDPERLSHYLRPEQLHTAFNFPYTTTPWDAGALRSVIDATLETHGRVGATPTWVLSNHDTTRHVTRLGRPYTGVRRREIDDIQPVDVALGTRRARAAALLMLALPGSVYLYQGEELGLWEVEDLPEEKLEDPIWERSGRTVRGRDGCRVPIPWSGNASPFGFGPAGSTPWLPQPAGWRSVTVEAETGDPASMLELYRAALRLRRRLPGLVGADLRWLASPEGTLLFGRDDRFRCAVNLSGAPLDLPGNRTTLLATEALVDDRLAPDAAIWFEVGRP